MKPLSVNSFSAWFQITSEVVVSLTMGLPLELIELPRIYFFFVIAPLESLKASCLLYQVIFILICDLVSRTK